MTTIAWDGKTLAADKQATGNNTISTTTKLRILPNGEVIAWANGIASGLVLAKWYEDGADPEKWPESQHTEDWAFLLVVKPDGTAMEYENQPIAHLVEDPKYAWGSGGPVALGALAMGATAHQAIEIAARYDIMTGQGVDCVHIIE